MDAVDPHLVEHAELSLKGIESVAKINSLRLRWVGHSLHMVAELELKADTSPESFHQIRLLAIDSLRRDVPILDDIVLSLIPISE
jgi:divalent metal cation (Fe/Co/Zn/Cd) transporter